MILSIDTTSEFGSIALTDASHIVEELALHAPDGFGHVLFQHVQDLLDRNGLVIHQLDGLAAATGPGSFTGVRVGLTAAKGLAEAAGKRMVGVSNLRALASFGSAALRVPVIDARRGEVYAAVYDQRLEIVLPEAVMPLDAWLTAIAKQSGSFEFISFESLAGLPISPTIASRSLAAAIGRIAADEFAQGRAHDPAEIDANYVRRSDAELFWKDASESSRMKIR